MSDTPVVTPVPHHWRLQELAMVGKMFVVLAGEPFCFYLMYRMLYSSLWWLALIYLVWMVNDLDICDRGGRACHWVKCCSWWRHYCEYFPIKLVKTAELDNSKNYLFACFPYEFNSFGTFGTFANARFRHVFPGMTCNIISSKGRFLVPFSREFFLACGACAGSLQSLLHLLDPKKYQGKCVALVVGGSDESKYSLPGEYTVLLSRRKGFVRVAMMAGSSLVPVITFGETSLYRSFKTPEGSFKRRFQDWYLKVTGLFGVIPSGRGIFGLLPFRHPLAVVVGAPMEVKKNLEPSMEEVNLVHGQFTRRLQELFEQEKHKYLDDPEDVRLVVK